MNDNQLENIKRLLKAVNSEIEKSEEITRLKGEKFNIFSILGIETKENMTHSNFIAALLNPRGEHGLGSKFLNLFYETLLQAIPENGSDNSENIISQKKIIQALKNEIAIVETEFSIGKVDYGNTEGGRVDIAISGNGGRIFIENKIYAGDQYQQIARYNNSNQNTIVFYLTLDGKSPDKSSSGKLKENQDFFLLSYRDDIKNWLEKCLKEASDFPIVRETIKQYLILIKKLTGQLTYNEMENKIQQLIVENIEESYVIYQKFENSIRLVKKEFVNVLYNILKEKYPKLNIKFSSDKYHFFIRAKNNDWHKDLSYHLQVGIRMQYEYLCFGITFNRENDKINIVKNKLGSLYIERGDAYIATRVNGCDKNLFSKAFLKKCATRGFIEDEAKHYSSSIFEFIDKTIKKLDDINTVL